MSTRTEFSMVSSFGLFIIIYVPLFKLLEVSGASLAAHQVFNRLLDFVSAREHSPCHIGAREHLQCRSRHRPLWVARACRYSGKCRTSALRLSITSNTSLCIHWNLFSWSIGMLHAQSHSHRGFRDRVESPT